MSISNLAPVLGGGILFGAGAALLELGASRVAGFSGIVAGVVDPSTRREHWRWWVLAGLVLAGGIGLSFDAAAVSAASPRAWPLVAIAGLLVGFGTRIGRGCTSGHGVCGVSHGAPRSLAATATFMATGFFAFQLVRLGEVLS